MRIIKLSIILLLLLSCNKEKKKSITHENDIIEVYDFSEFEPQLYYDDDNIYVINFWATWCKPCIEEMPFFQELHNDFKDQKVKVVLVSLDFPDKIQSHLIPFIKRNNLTPQVILLDDPYENEWIPKVDSSWSGAIPATLIYKKNKRAFYEQSFTKESLYKEINKFIKLEKS